jgi:hypothetical protein
MPWLLIAGLAWTVLAVTGAVILGRGIRLADERASAGPWTDQADQFLRQQARLAPAAPGSRSPDA